MENLYRHFDAAGNLLYVGISFNALHRLSQHREHSSWFEKIARVDILQFETREAAAAAEKNAIQEENPVYNVVFKAKPLRGLVSEAFLTSRLVRFKATHSIDEVASELGIGPGAVKDLIRSGALGYVVLPGKHREEGRIRVTGWQLIEYIERLEIASQAGASDDDAARLPVWIDRREKAVS